MKKKSLFLVHSYPTNSILLGGLAEFLEDYFDLHFIDLPGFAKHSPPLRNVSIDGYARFLESRIEAAELDEYILGGISFGHLVVTKTRIDHRCKAILSMEPFLGKRSLYMGFLKRFVLGSFARTVAASGMAPIIWNSSRFRARMLRRGEPELRVDTMLRELDPYTYFATAGILVRFADNLNWRDLPYILIVNPNDKTINAEDVTDVFKSHVDRLLVLETTIDHYPKEVTKQYFTDRITQQHIEKLLSYLECYWGNDKTPFFEIIRSP
jgi:pimeloyl-ACP methyl ester carboxylesterase